MASSPMTSRISSARAWCSMAAIRTPVQTAQIALEKIKSRWRRRVLLERKRRRQMGETGMIRASMFAVALLAAAVYAARRTARARA